jgi:hypothetical protein
MPARLRATVRQCPPSPNQHTPPTKQIQLERRKVLMLQQQLEQLTAKLGDTRHAMGSIFSAKEKSVALQKQIKIMENRLEKQYIKYNEVGWGVLSWAC